LSSVSKAVTAISIELARFTAQFQPHETIQVKTIHCSIISWVPTWI